MPKKSRLKVWLVDQRHKELSELLLILFWLCLPVLASFSASVQRLALAAAGLWGKRAGLFPDHPKPVVLFGVHEFNALIGLD